MGCPDLPTVPECIRWHREADPEALAVALREGSRWVSYPRRQFWNHVAGYAALFARELPEPTLILFSKRLDLHLLTAYVGAMAAGHLPAQISPPTPKLSAEEYRRKIGHIRELTRFGAMFTDARPAPDGGTDGRVFTPADWRAADAEPTTAVREDALVQFSSGTTGLQKGVILTHRALVTHMRAYAETLGLGPGDAIVSWLPLYHDMGLIACYLLPLMCGLPFYQMDPFDWVMQPDLLLATIEEKKPTLTFLPNFAYPLLAAKGRPHDLSSIRRWVNCSEPARAQSHAQFCARFPSVRPETLTVCYALAENTFAATQSQPGDTRPVDGVLSCGRPVPGVELALFDVDDAGVGEIGLRSPMLFSRFLDGTRPLTDGYYRTGDLGRRNAAGELFVTGRKKDLIIVCGKNIFPQDVEHAASQVAGVYPGRTVAFGVWNPEAGSEDLYVLAERQAPAAPTGLKLAIQRAVQEETGIVPRRVEIVEHMTLVKTSSGKICRSRNRELYLARKIAPL